MRTREGKDPLRNMALRWLNKQIDREFHRYFDDPNKCVEAVFIDTLTHQAVESILGLPQEEIARRTTKYFPKGLERCLNAVLTGTNKKS